MDIKVTGDSKNGGPFVVEGDNFGPSGELKIGGVAIKSTSWSDTRIKGFAPAGLFGDVVVATAIGERKCLWRKKV